MADHTRYPTPGGVENAIKDAAKKAAAADETREYESDLLFVVDDVAVCVEVKAGSRPD